MSLSCPPAGAHPWDGIEVAARTPLDEAQLGMALGQNISSPNRVLASKNTFASVAVGLPELVRSPRTRNRWFRLDASRTVFVLKWELWRIAQ